MKIDHPEILAAANQPNDFYRLGQYLREHGPQMLHSAQDPANMALGGAALLGGAAAALAAPKLVGPALALEARLLSGQPGSVMLGYRTGRWGITYPVRLTLLDRFVHVQVVAPTGGAKTSFFEYIHYQDLRSGLTTLCIENAGNFGLRAMSRALLLGKPVYLFDPTVKNTLKWNPLEGEAEEVAERAVDSFVSSAASGDEEFFRGLNGSLLRHIILALKSYGAHNGFEVHMGDVYDFLLDRSYRQRVLKISRPNDDKKGPPKVNATYLPRKTKLWFENKYLRDWTQRQREEFTMGLFNAVDALIGRSIVERALCPEEGEETLNLDEAIDSGGFILLSVPRGRVGEVQARTLSTWLMMTKMQAIRRRGEGGRPISVYIDEAHSMLGHASSDAAAAFAGFLPEARHYHTILQLSYQSFGQLPPDLKTVLHSNARSRLIGGGHAGDDASEGLEIIGSTEEQVTDRRHTYKGLFSFPGSYSIGTREMERPAMSEEEMRLRPRGHWNARIVKNGADQRPIVLRAGRAPTLKAVFEPERITVSETDRRGRDPRREKGVVT